LAEVPVSRTGDLWVLGHHRILVGDATVENDVRRLMGADVADLIFTDTPYNVDYEG
jgi:DNA modification methylase